MSRQFQYVDLSKNETNSEEAGTLFQLWLEDGKIFQAETTAYKDLSKMKSIILDREDAVELDSEGAYKAIEIMLEWGLRWGNESPIKGLDDEVPELLKEILQNWDSIKFSSNDDVRAVGVNSKMGKVLAIKDGEVLCLEKNIITGKMEETTPVRFLSTLIEYAEESFGTSHATMDRLIDYLIDQRPKFLGTKIEFDL